MGNDRLEAMAETKLLDFHASKCKIIITGSPKSREKLRNDFEDNPVTLYGENIEVVSHETYLGDELGQSVAESISLTIKKREGLVRKSIIEIKRIVSSITNSDLC